MSVPIRIGLLTPAWPGCNTPNGITTAVFHLAEGFRDIGHAPVIMTGRIDGELTGGFDVVSKVPSHWSWTERIFARLIGRETVLHNKIVADISEMIREAHARFGIDLVIMEETNGWGQKLSHLVPVPIVLYLHGPWSLLLNAFERAANAKDKRRIELEEGAFACASGLLAPSASAISAAEGLGPEVPRAIIPNALPCGPNPDTSYHNTGHILFVGRVDRLKGADTVLRAFDILAAHNQHAHLTFVGPDRGLRLDDGRTVSIKEAIDILCQQSRDRITYLGSQSTNQIKLLRRTHPVAIMASRYETLSYTLLEAMAAGQAIVATNVGGPAEVLCDGVTATLVEAGDANAMADALKLLLDNPRHAENLATAARSVIATEFAPNLIAQRTLTFCRDLLAPQSHT